MGLALNTASLLFAIVILARGVLIAHRLLTNVLYTVVAR